MGTEGEGVYGVRTQALGVGDMILAGYGMASQREVLNYCIRRILYSQWNCFLQSVMHVSS